MYHLRNLGVALLTTVLAFGTQTSRGQPQTAGAWESRQDWPLKAIHMILLRNGHVLAIDQPPPGTPATQPNVMVFNPTTAVINTATNMQQQGIDANFNLFCSGHAQIDGRVFFAGGGIFPPGTSYSAIFDPDQISAPNGPWVYAQPDMPSPYGERWYPTCTALANGKVLVSGGRNTVNVPCGPNYPANNPLIFDPNAPVGQQYTPLLVSPLVDLYFYPHMFLVSSNELFFVGGDELDAIGCTHPRVTKALNTALGTWRDVANYPCFTASAVIYRPNKILRGGASQHEYTCGASVQVLDAGASNPSWDSHPSLNHARHFHTMTMLADGRVLTIGGRVNQPDGAPIRTPEWADPVAGGSAAQWQDLAPHDSDRTYHSTVLLLPDARVLLAGGEDTPYQKTYEIFKPPYLFAANGSPATRPQIKSAETDSNLVYSEAFTIKLLSPAPEQIARVALVRLGAMTHSFDQDTRYVPLNFTVSGPDTLKAAAPSHGYEAPPGYYMLFVLSNGDRPGILFPSIAKIVRHGQGIGA